MKRASISAALIGCFFIGSVAAEQVVVRRSIAAPVAPGLGVPEGEVVKNAPVHARLVTRSVRELCDGNRIVREHSEVLHRDSAGRERRELSEGGSTVVFLRDGAKRVVLDTSHGLAVPLPDVSPGGGTAVFMGRAGVAVAPEVEVEIEQVDAPSAPTPPPAGKKVKVIKKVLNSASVDSPEWMTSGVALPHDFVELLGAGAGGETQVEPLGQKKIAGLRVEGTRHTTTFAAGAFGNEKPLDVVKTTWYSPDLRMMIRSEEFDPRSGTVTYEAEVVSRDEPDAALFEVPEGLRKIEVDAM